MNRRDFIRTAAAGVGGLSVSGGSAWFFGPLVVWAVALVAELLLPFVIFKKTLARRADQH